MISRDGRAGLTLPELLLVVVIIGMLVAFGFPRMRQGVLRNEVISARNAMANMYTTARLTALQTGRNVTFARNGNVVVVTAAPRLDGAAGSDTVGAVIDLNDRHGVTVSGTPVTLTVNPKGLGGTAFTWTVTRAEFSGVLEVSAFGRILQ
jgi:prepilin-type N-terminal cleavage/methylation domain-containing protein